jgi:DNA modification methylase
LKPYYERGGLVIYHGDCRAVMPSLPADSVDLVLADPPYGIKQADWDAYVPLDWFGDALRLLRQSGAAYVFGDSVKLAELQAIWQMRGVQWAGRIAWCYEEGPASQKCVGVQARGLLVLAREAALNDGPPRGEQI